MQQDILDIFDKKRYKINKPNNWKKMRMHEKIRYYASQLDEKYACFVDKLEAKKIVKLMCDKVKTANVVRILDNYTDIRPEDINTNHIIKTSHASGWNINITNSTFNNAIKGKIIKKLEKWNRHFDAPFEKQYLYIEPRFFVEEKITEISLKNTGCAPTFMFRCVYGKAITVGYKEGIKQNYYNINWIPIMKGELHEVSKPDNLQEMVEVAETLSQPFEFVRIDLYNGIDGIYFSEFTFTPASGNKVFTSKLEKDYGNLWT